jgi:hypothetical protein
MKSKITKILGIGVAFAMLASMTVGLTAAPAGAAVGSMKFGAVDTPSNVGVVLGGQDTAGAITGQIDADLIAVSPDGKTVFVYDDFANLMYKSTDGGVTFAKPKSVGTAATTAIDLVVSPNFILDKAAVLLEPTHVWLTVNGGSSWADVANADLMTKLETGMITSVDVGNYYADNTLSIIIGVTSGGLGGTAVSNALKFKYGDFAWTELGNIDAAGIGDYSVVGIKFSPNHMTDAEILCAYVNGDTFLSSKYGTLE